MGYTNLTMSLLKERKTFIPLILLALAALLLVITLLLRHPRSPEPNRTDFAASTPTHFPTNIPVEAGAPLSQSYSLDYAGRAQLSIVFPSTKTLKENYTRYTDFLTKDSWTIVNKYESKTVSSLYGKKEGSEINITLTQGQVSVSVLEIP